MPTGPFRDWFVSILDNLGNAISGTNPLPITIVAGGAGPGTITGTLTGVAQTVVLNNTVGAGTVAISLQAAAFTGTVTFEVSGDNTNWDLINTVSFDGTQAGTSIALAGAVNKLMVAPLQGAPFFRVRCSAYTSGSLVVVLWAGFGDGLLGTIASLTGLAGTGTPNALLGVGAYLLAKSSAQNSQLRDAAIALSTGVGTLSATPGIPAVTSLNAAVAPAIGTAFPLGVARSNFSMAITGTATTLSVNLELSLDGVTYMALPNPVVSLNKMLFSSGTPATFMRANATALSGGNVTALLTAY